MDILLFALGVVFVIIGLPFCWSCQIHAVWENRLKDKTSQLPYQHGRRDRIIGLVFMVIGVLLILLSFVPSVM